MNFDFNLIFVPITLILGAIWLFDKIVLKKHRDVKLRTKSLLTELKKQQTLITTQENELQALLSVEAKTLTQTTTKTKNEHNESDTDSAEVKRAKHQLEDSNRELSLIDNQLKAIKEPFFITWAYDFLPILVFILVMRSFIIEPFNIPSSSMVPTLYTGDFIAVNKYAYGLRLPLTHTKVLDTGHPEHGDVAVFRFPSNPSVYYIKRVIGLPGDTVAYAEGVLSINGVPIPTKATDFKVNTQLVTQMYRSGQQANGQMVTVEDAALRGKVEEEHAIYFQESIGKHNFYKRYLPLKMETAVHSELLGQIVSKSNPWQIKVPEGQYFVMGDNRDRSLDGRFWGFVPDDNLAGKAVYRWMHKSQGFALPTFQYNGKIQ